MFFHARDVPRQIDRMDLHQQLERERQRVEELRLGCKKFLLLCIVDSAQRFLRARYLQYGAVFGLLASAKARHAISDPGQIETNLNRAIAHRHPLCRGAAQLRPRSKQGSGRGLPNRMSR